MNDAEPSKRQAMMATKLFTAIALLIWAAGVVQAASGDTSVSEPTMGYCFEAPRGCIVKRSVDGRGAQIPG